MNRCFEKGLSERISDQFAKWLTPPNADLVANLDKLNMGQLPTAWFGAMNVSYEGELPPSRCLRN